jgi:hypothetical protein
MLLVSSTAWSHRLYYSFQWCLFCVELENRLLARFDAASQRRELSSMAECAKILSQVNTFVRFDM